MSTPDCPSDDRLRAFDRGDVSDAELEIVGGHLGACPSCVGRLTALATPAPVAAALLAADPPDDPEYWRAVERVTGKPNRHSKPRLAPGDRLGEYRLVEQLGEGGMGTVYKAVHVRLGREVALKVLRRRLEADADAAVRFEREMRAVGQLRHPNIVQATDAGEAGGILFLVMELVEGQDLADYVLDHGPLPTAEAIAVIRQAATALQHAHDAGFVHRDVKPSNLIRAKDGVVKLLDLGLATLPTEALLVSSGDTSSQYSATRPGLTSASKVVGTYEYMAPEQKRDSRTVDARADVYSLGCTLWFLLTGKPPRAENLLGSGHRPVGLPAELWRQFLATNPADRFPSAAAAAAALARPLPKPRPPRRPYLAVGGAAAVLGLAALGVYVAWPPPPGPADPAPAPGTGAGLGAGPVVVSRPTLPMGRLPLTGDEARRLQSAWAEHLGVPVAVEGPHGMKFVLIPPGELGLTSESRVRITRAYYLGVHEVTRGQFGKFAAQAGYKTTTEPPAGPGGRSFQIDLALGGDPHADPKPRPELTWRAPGYPNVTDDHPVSQVSWHDARAFCASLSGDGAVYRLPTAAEAAWATRCGDASDDILPRKLPETLARGWFNANATTPQPVGRRSPTAWGSHDLLGNVCEWCQDLAGEPPAGVLDDWAGPAGDGPERMTTNTSFMSPVLRFRFRTRESADWAFAHVGFRVVREVAVPHKADPPPGPPPAPRPALGRLPMAATEATAFQKVWADYLGQPVTVDGPAGTTFALIPPGEVGLSTECRVTVTRPYYVGTTEVTVAQFRAFVEATGYKTEGEATRIGGMYTKHVRPMRGAAATSSRTIRGQKINWRTPGPDDVTDDHPVTQVSWPDANKFCRWLGEQDGATYRLPSEAEWTWAARAGRVEDILRGGADTLGVEAWNSANTDLVPCPVGKLKPNAWGLFDTFGNVGEMCLDLYNIHPVGSFIDWRGPDRPRITVTTPPNDQHLVKSTSCLSVNLRFTDRESIGVWKYGSWVTGFRVVREVP